MMATSLSLAIVFLIACQTQAAYVQPSVPIILDTWVKDVVNASSPARFYTFDGSAGQYVSIQMQRDAGSPRLRPYVELKEPYGYIVASDDGGSSGNSLIEGYYLQSTGTYTIIAHSYNNQTYGVYWIYVTLSQ